mgnify:CR=1 FL=1
MNKPIDDLITALGLDPNEKGIDLPSETRGIPLRISAFDSKRIHDNLVAAYDDSVDSCKIAGDFYSKTSSTKWKIYNALLELEIRIDSQEKESGIGGTQFRLYSKLSGDDENGEQE